MKFDSGHFIYYDALPLWSRDNIPHQLQLTIPSHAAVLIRLLLGTLNLESKSSLGLRISQRVNYSRLGISQAKPDSRALFDSDLDIRADIEGFNKYLVRSRKNYVIYEAVLAEFSNFFIQKHRGSHVAGFVHLYRCLEQMSFSFPLIYAISSNSFKGSYESLKSYFLKTGTRGSELVFFKAFQAEVIDDAILSQPVDLKVKASDSTMLTLFNNIIVELCDSLAPTVDTGTGFSTISYKHLFEFFLRLRNRFFHYSSGSDKSNISSLGMDCDMFFETLNEILANWLSFICFEIFRIGFENM